LADYNYFLAHPNKIYEMDLAILRPLFQMEKNGVLVDVQKLGEISDLLHAQADELQTKIWELAGEEFNIASPKQLAGILFDKLGLPADKKRSTEADKLSDLAAESEIARLVLDWRSRAKLSGTYADALPKAIAEDGRIHTTYLQTSTSTGRLSSRDPNLQNIPIKTEIGAEIRKCFVAAPGNVLIAADYSQIQLRLLAHLSGAKALVDAFVAGKDIHAETAEKIFGICTPENRRIAKTINFSIIYGVSPFGLSAQLGISQREAAAIIDNYMAGLPEIKRYMDETKKFALENGFIETPFGRRVTFPDIGNPAMRASSLRAAANAPIQGFEADIMRLALAKLARLPIKMILQVHDEIVFECAAAEAEGYARQIKEIMESIVKISVPLTAGYTISERWDK
jgi:DNA polymerase-1